MKNHKMITILMTMILSVSSCFSAYCAETSSAETSISETSVPEMSAAEIPAEEASESETFDEEAPDAEILADEMSDAETIDVETSADETSEAEDTAAQAAQTGSTAEEGSSYITGDNAEGPAAAAYEEIEEASDDAEIILEEEPEEQAYTPEDTKSADELFAAYVDTEFGIPDEGAKPGLLKKRATAGSKLKSDTLAAYNYVSAQLPLIASGEITSSHFTVPDEDVAFITETAWTAEDLGVSAIEENGAITQEAKDAASQRLREEYFDLSILIDALLADHPYLLYWYDKTPKTTAGGYRYRAYKDNGVWTLGFRGSLTLNFPVAEEYAAGDYTVDASVGQAVQASAENALAAVAEYEDLPDFAKLAAYRQEICSLTSYNYGAVAGITPYGNPWQLIWVFDGDPATNVVCEGYAKAFKYLCDKSSFEDEIDCKTVTGKINGAGHMWNLVTMEDGLNYIADITNCDSGTAGANDKLFIVGAAGSPQKGYAVKYSGSGRMNYTYDQDMLDLWSEEELTVAADSYYPLRDAVVDGIEDKIYTGSGITQDLFVMYRGRILTEGEDYTVSYENNTDAGTAGLTIEGSDRYRGTIEEEFVIGKAPQVLEVSADRILAGSTAAVRITGAQGEVTAEIPDTAVAEITGDDGNGTFEIRSVSIGTAVLTVTAAETDNYKETVLDTEIRVVPGATTHVGLTNLASGIKIYWNEVPGARYYKVYRGEKYLFATSRLYATDTEVKSDNGTRYTYRVVASTAKNDDRGDSTVSRTGTGYRLIPVGIISLKNPAAGKLAVTYGGNAKSTGYVIRFSLKEDMSDAKVITVQGAGTLQRVLSGVIKGRTYYVQVRTYKLENGKRYYSGYCTTKSLKVIR